jgi:predicted DNA-binding transcriptional regulator AlpA
MSHERASVSMEQPVARYLDVQGAAAYLHLSRWTLYKLVERRRIPFIPIQPAEGGEAKRAIVRFDALVLDRWMAQQAVNPPSASTR